MPRTEEIRSLALENAGTYPEFTALHYWPHDDEFRMVYVDPHAMETRDGRVHLSAFGAGPGQPYDLVVGVVRPEEIGRLSLPDDFGGWDKAIVLDLRSPS